MPHQGSLSPLPRMRDGRGLGSVQPRVRCHTVPLALVAPAMRWRDVGRVARSGLALLVRQAGHGHQLVKLVAHGVPRRQAVVYGQPAYMTRQALALYALSQLVPGIRSANVARHGWQALDSWPCGCSARGTRMLRLASATLRRAMSALHCRQNPPIVSRLQPHARQ